VPSLQTAYTVKKDRILTTPTSTLKTEVAFRSGTLTSTYNDASCHDPKTTLLSCNKLLGYFFQFEVGRVFRNKYLKWINSIKLSKEMCPFYWTLLFIKTGKCFPIFSSHSLLTSVSGIFQGRKVICKDQSLSLSGHFLQTWACILVLMAIVTPLLNYFHRHSPYYEYFCKNNVKGGLNSLYNCLWYVYGALLQQGMSRFFQFLELFTCRLHRLIFFLRNV
jgi:hypothetical protein